ncbi:MAG: hypothetical protein OXU51_03085 [Candidatus Poribacteria bacterium]|nr:hypothetical protein [Candidatus Poribacteria bacterium]
MNEIVIGILALFMLVVIGILRAILTQPDAKRSGRRPRWTPQRRGDKPPQPKVTRLPQAPSPIQPDIREKRDPYFSKRPPRIPKSVSDPFDYQAGWWKEYSTWYREQRNWTCEVCHISLNDDRYYLHTHHIWGTQYNDPKDLMALCIGCHSEQPGGYHSQLKESRDYQGFMEKYGQQWRLRRYD